jgi:hypothetical protein
VDKGLEDFLVRVVFEDGFLFVTAGGDVIHRAGVFDAEGTSHDEKLIRILCKSQTV